MLFKSVTINFKAFHSLAFLLPLNGPHTYIDTFSYTHIYTRIHTTTHMHTNKQVYTFTHMHYHRRFLSPTHTHTHTHTQRHCTTISHAYRTQFSYLCRCRLIFLSGKYLLPFYLESTHLSGSISKVASSQRSFSLKKPCFLNTLNTLFWKYNPCVLLSQ